MWRPAPKWPSFLTAAPSKIRVICTFALCALAPTGSSSRRVPRISKSAYVVDRHPPLLPVCALTAVNCGVCVQIWDIKKNKVKLVFSGHEQDIYSLDFSRDGRFVCSGSGDKTARIWNMETGKCTYTLCDESNNKDAGVTSVAMSPDGRFVAAGSLDRVVRVWDARTGQFVERFEGHKDSVYSVAFSPDGRSLVSGSLDKTLKLWELGTGSKTRSPCRMTFEGHRDFVLSVAFSPDGRYVVSGSKDRSVQFWDPNTGVSQCVLQGHKNSVISVALSPDANYFATGSGDFKARIWRYEVAKP